MSVVWIEPDGVPVDPPEGDIKGYPIDYSVEPDKGPEPLGGGEPL
jgi:hypothetical protein